MRLLTEGLDRLVRRPSAFERLWAVAERRRVFIASVTEPVDSNSPIGIALLRILVALAGMESATTGIRISAQRRSEAEAGNPPATKAYGHPADWTAIVPDEAAVIRESVNRALDGERLEQIARDLRARGIPRPREKRGPVHH
ncbi:MAG: recombinase family protein [Acidimicrobiales bacterium]|nr:recombinase family protein [Acidimicrobiales bacterium]